METARHEDAMENQVNSKRDTIAAFLSPKSCVPFSDTSDRKAGGNGTEVFWDSEEDNLWK